MRFDRRKSSPLPKMAPVSHSRLWGLFLALTFVLLSIKIAADPATWAWLFHAESDQTTSAPSLSDVTYDVDLTSDNQLRSDEFRSEPSITPVPGGQSTVTGATDDQFGEEHLSSVKDNTLSIRAEERPAFSLIFDQLGNIQKRVTADNTATYPAVMVEPEYYRGRLITVEGTARGVTKLPAGVLTPESPPLYELWLFSSDSGNNPWRILARRVPENLQSGPVEMNASVKLSGVFFKRQGYETVQHNLHVAPLLLADDVTLTRSVASPSKVSSATSWLVVGLAVFSASLFLFIYRLTRMRRSALRLTNPAHRSSARQLGESDDDSPDPSAFLAALASNPLITANAEDGSERTKDVHRRS